MNLDQISNILTTGSYKNWSGTNYKKFINFLATIDISSLDYEAHNAAIYLLEKDHDLIIENSVSKIKLVTREEQMKQVPKVIKKEWPIYVISGILVFLTFYFIFKGMGG